MPTYIDLIGRLLMPVTFATRCLAVGRVVETVSSLAPPQFLLVKVDFRLILIDGLVKRVLVGISKVL